MSTSKKYHVQFKKSFSTEFPFIIESRKGVHFAFCTDCRCDFSISHSGRRDIVTHSKSSKHLNFAKLRNENSKINSLFSTEDLSVIQAECYFTAFLIEHNVPISCADHTGPLFRKMFRTPEVAKQYGSARTKTTAIVNLMAKECQEALVSRLKKQTFSIATDGSNNNEKYYPIVVTTFNEDSSLIESSLMCAPILEGESTGRNIGQLLVDNLLAKDIPLENCISFGSDNANVMLGKVKGAASVLSEVNPNIIIIGCVCHLIDIAASKGIKSLPFNIDDVLVDVYYYLKRSSKRKDKLRELQRLHDTEMKRILKHVETRWLSVGKCLQRILEQWSPLLTFFEEENLSSRKRTASSSNLNLFKIPKAKKAKCSDVPVEAVTNKSIHPKVKSTKITEPTKKKSLPKEISPDDPEKPELEASYTTSRKSQLLSFFSSDLNKALCLFLSTTISVLEKFCTILQSQKPLIHILRSLIEELFKELLSKFVRPDVVKRYPSLFALDYRSRHHQKDDDEMVIGTETSEAVGKLSKEKQTIFFVNVRKFFVNILDYIYHSFPFNNEPVLKAEVFNVKKISLAKFSDLKYFLEKFPFIPSLISKDDVNFIDDVQSEFSELQMENIPSDILDSDRIDTQWVLIGKIKNEMGVEKYKKLSKLMLSFLVIPHSNAECERIFSQMRKIKTDFRPSMSSQNLESLLIVKSAQLSNSKCFEQEFSRDFLKKAKSATYNSLYLIFVSFSFVCHLFVFKFVYCM